MGKKKWLHFKTIREDQLHFLMEFLELIQKEGEVKDKARFWGTSLKDGDAALWDGKARYVVILRGKLIGFGHVWEVS